MTISMRCEHRVFCWAYSPVDCLWKEEFCGLANIFNKMQEEAEIERESNRVREMYPIYMNDIYLAKLLNQKR